MVLGGQNSIAARVLAWIVCWIWKEFLVVLIWLCFGRSGVSGFGISCLGSVSVFWVGVAVWWVLGVGFGFGVVVYVVSWAGWFLVGLV